jgi:hypothetical protein
MSFATRFMYVGIGGSGLKIGKAFERLLRDEVCGPDGRRLIRRGGTFANLQPRQLPDFIQSLYLDFSEQDLVSLQNDLLPHAPEAALRTATFVKALSSSGHSSVDVTDLLRVSKSASAATASWLPPRQSEWGQEPAFAPLSTGAGQYPTIGRAALFAYMEKYGAESLLRDFRKPLARIVSSIGQLEEYVGSTTASRNVVILVGCSLSGGTGAGIFMDVIRLMAHEASAQLGGTPFVIVPLVLLPSAFDNVLVPSKRKNAVLNATRALADLGRLIDAQNAPGGDGSFVKALYPGGHGGNGTLEVTLPSAAVKTAFLFHRPADIANDGALSESVARFAANLLRQPSVSKLASGPLGSGRTMTLLDKLVNNAGLLQERHPTFIGRRPFASAACVSIPDGREHLVELAAEQMLAACLTDATTGISDEEIERRAILFQREARLEPPTKADIDPQRRSAVMNMSTPEETAVSSAMRAYQAALSQVMPAGGQPHDGSIPDGLSAGAAAAFEQAVRLGDSGPGWIDALSSAATAAGTDLFGMLPAASMAATRWSSGQLLGKPKVQGGRPVDFPNQTTLIRIQREGILGTKRRPVLDPDALRTISRAEESQLDATWRNYLKNPKGTPVRFTAAAGALMRRVEESRKALETWSNTADREDRRDRQADVRDRFMLGPDPRLTFDRVVIELGHQFGLANPTAVTVGREILRRKQADVVDKWKTRDGGEPKALPIRLLEAVREYVESAFEQPTVYTGIRQVLQDWADSDEGQLSEEVQQFRTAMLTSITDSLVPPALDRSIEPMVTIAYPGEQNTGVEDRLSGALATHPSFARYLELSAPTFVPRAAGNALVISVSLVGQGLADVPDGAAGLTTWVESAFRPDPTDRLAWRQREGYKDTIDFLDAVGRAELVQRLMAAAWNGELVADHADGMIRSLSLRFGADDAPELSISLEDMPFAQQLAPLADAYLRAIANRYVSDTETVTEILNELARSVPQGFVERRMPTSDDLQRADLFFDFVPALGHGGRKDTEQERLRQLLSQIAAAPAVMRQAKREHQIREYLEFWDHVIPHAMQLSFGTLGYGTFAELVADLRPRSDVAPELGHVEELAVRVGHDRNGH